MRRTLSLVAVSGLIAAAAGHPMADYVSNRRMHMIEMNQAMLDIGRQVGSRRPDRTALSSRAARIAILARAMPGSFRKGSGIESGQPTAALPAIWVRPRVFVGRAFALANAAQKLQSLARNGSVVTLAAQARILDQACVACHREFRVPE